MKKIILFFVIIVGSIPLSAQTLGREILIYSALIENIKQTNSSSLALLSIAQYSSYEQMPDYLKLVSDTSDAYVYSFQIIEQFGQCYTDGQNVRIDWGNNTSGRCYSEEEVINASIEYLTAKRTERNSIAIDALIERMSLGLAQNILIAVTDYLDFVSAVENAESSYYDETIQNQFVFDGEQISEISREQQLLLVNTYNSIKNDNYKIIAKALIKQSTNFLQYLDSDIELPSNL